MNKKTNYNSIVFLTTLSVYLGLVLVGGAPQVFAQAALTRDFDIKNEIEFKDDLDNKPDDEKALAVYGDTLEDLFLLAKNFSAQNAEKLAENKYEFDCFFGIARVGKGTFCKGGLFTSDFIPSFEKIHSAFPHASEEIKEQIKINLLLRADEFSLKTVLYQSSDEQAEQYHNFYVAGLSKIKLQTGVPQAVIYQNTSISFENNQVFIVTRLPRASIDELFARKVAQ